MKRFEVVAVACVAMSIASGMELVNVPLAEGNQWELVNSATATTYTVSVPSSFKVGDKRISKFAVTTPFWALTFLVSPENNELKIEGMDYPQARYYFTGGSLFQENVQAGAQWANFLGTTRLVSTGLTISTPAGTFRNVSRYEVMFGGSPMDWFLAPNVGIVRIGSDSFPYLLKTYRAAPWAEPATQSISASCPKVGIAPNPNANGDFSTAGERQALIKAVDAGSRFLHISASWAELEPSPNVYSLAALQRQMEWAAAYGMDGILTVKTIDNTVVSMPSDLTGRSLNDPVVLSRFKNLLSAIAPILNSSIKAINVGNEVNAYFARQQTAIVPFIAFTQASSAHLKSLNKRLPVGATFAFADFKRDDGIVRFILPYIEQVSFTYYPLREDWVAVSPTVSWDLGEMVRAAAGKPLFLTEAGFPSSALLLSDNATQQRFYSALLQESRKYPTKIGGISFFAMSDIPTSVVSQLSTYYGSNASRFIAFLASLGLHDQLGAPKPAWDTFVTEARAMVSTSCSATQLLN